MDNSPKRSICRFVEDFCLHPHKHPIAKVETLGTLCKRIAIKSYQQFINSARAFLLQHFNQFCFHLLVNIPIAGECPAALLMAGQSPDQIGVFDLFV